VGKNLKRKKKKKKVRLFNRESSPGRKGQPNACRRVRMKKKSVKGGSAANKKVHTGKKAGKSRKPQPKNRWGQAKLGGGAKSGGSRERDKQGTEDAEGSRLSELGARSAIVGGEVDEEISRGKEYCTKVPWEIVLTERLGSLRAT